MRAGILLGAGFASLMRVFDPSQPFMGKIPMSFSIAALGSFFILRDADMIAAEAKGCHLFTGPTERSLGKDSTYFIGFTPQ